MHDRRDRIDELGARVVFVAFDLPEALRSGLLADVELVFPVAADEARTTYEAWGLGRASSSDIWLDPKVWWQYLKLLMSGEQLRSGGDDPLQLGGDFVVDPDGVIAYSRPQQRDDRPPVGEILRVVQQARDR